MTTDYNNYMGHGSVGRPANGDVPVWHELEQVWRPEPSIRDSGWIQVPNSWILDTRTTFLLVPGIAGKLFIPVGMVLCIKTLAVSYAWGQGSGAFLTLMTSTTTDQTFPMGIDLDYAFNTWGEGFIPAWAGYWPGSTNFNMSVGALKGDVGSDLVLAQGTGSSGTGGSALNEIYVRAWYVEVTLP